MKWIKKEKKKPLPDDHERRTIRKFLFFPKCIKREYRWLETVSIDQVYYALEIHKCRGIFGGDDFYSTGGYWHDERFV